MNHASLILNIALLKQMVLAPMQIFFSILILESFLSKVIIKTTFCLSRDGGSIFIYW